MRRRFYYACFPWVFPRRERQKVVPEGTRVVLFTGSWHQTLTDLCSLALLFGSVYPIPIFMGGCEPHAHDVLFILDPGRV
jgi:hypothetical protein